ncbi:MAG: hypothetical protein WCL02_05460 [bacterium]
MLAHKQTPTSNSFIESMKQIYEQLETNEYQKKYILTPIIQSKYRKTDFAYQRMISPKEITSE